MAIKIINQPKISNVFCDKLSITLQIPYEHEDEIVKKINYFIEHGYASRCHTSAYRLSARCLLGEHGESTFLIQCDPKWSGLSFFRVEFNPSKDPMGEVRELINTVLPGGYKMLVENGKCTRVDATVDLHHVDINELIVSCSGIQKTSAYYSGGNIQTYYLGSKKSPKLRCVYDKNAEIKRKKKTAPYPHSAIPNLNNITPYPYSVTRVEARITDGFPLKSISSIKDPFEKLAIAHVAQLAPHGDELFNLFLKLCASEGGQNSLLGLTESKRKNYRKLLKQGKPDWWDSKSIWKGWGIVSEGILNPPQSSYSLSMLVT